MSCEQLAGGKRAELAKRAGIRPRSTYVIVEVARAGNERLVCLRSPWGGCSWEGKWKAGAPEWMRKDANGKSPLDHLQHCSSAHAAAAVSRQGGYFWMGLRDFCSLFDVASACRLFAHSVPRAVIADSWAGESAGARHRRS